MVKIIKGYIYLYKYDINNIKKRKMYIFYS